MSVTDKLVAERTPSQSREKAFTEALSVGNAGSCPGSAPELAPRVKTYAPSMPCHGASSAKYSPIGSLSDVTNDCVVLNITWDQVDRMGWEQRPAYLQDP